MFSRFYQEPDGKIPWYFIAVVVLFVAVPSVIAGAWLGWLTR
ncbi:hypothetical protein ThrDRAFT_04183 [Frankia casuarinae]|jgi:hypothetical protein|nr:hypothetical protein CcI6DRAFT_04752 [Frankia sp. CcI6]EYT90193.1 hypothetical protein ThrDRAFT_04183 [Frankia casuarinae]KDA40427.1 hypothetical protein BMG523Draft_04775 [Frankia sp. BMG5.23]KFB04635.1 hypothetical protein ALLO2DRAFT_02564 [Frankia sp. Allo2]OAA20799.1 hypothetical protein AAY23_10855 [Frankia casuarinae]